MNLSPPCLSPPGRRADPASMGRARLRPQAGPGPGRGHRLASPWRRAGSGHRQGPDPAPALGSRGRARLSRPLVEPSPLRAPGGVSVLSIGRARIRPEAEPGSRPGPAPVKWAGSVRESPRPGHRPARAHGPPEHTAPSQSRRSKTHAECPFVCCGKYSQCSVPDGALLAGMGHCGPDSGRVLSAHDPSQGLGPCTGIKELKHTMYSRFLEFFVQHVQR